MSKAKSKLKWKNCIGIDNITTKKDELIETFSSSLTITLDISEVESMDITAFQLIISAIKEAKIKNIEFSLLGNLQEGVIKFLISCGFTENNITTGENLAELVSKKIFGIGGINA